jgi:hypothetical protein
MDAGGDAGAGAGAGAGVGAGAGAGAGAGETAGAAAGGGAGAGAGAGMGADANADCAGASLPPPPHALRTPAASKAATTGFRTFWDTGKILRGAGPPGPACGAV